MTTSDKVCPLHQRPLHHRQGISKAGKNYDFWGCSVKENGQFCQHTEQAKPASEMILEELATLRTRIEDIWSVVKNR